MCGILVVKSKKKYPEKYHVESLKLMIPRGPDDYVFRYENNIFIGQTIQSFIGNAQQYREEELEVVFNGEIYNFQRLGYETDYSLVRDTVKSKQFKKFQSFNGPWAWAYTDFKDIYFAVDAQGEKHLFYYEDDDSLIICSEIAPILRYGKFAIELQNFSTKHYPVICSTPYRGIYKCRAGKLYKNARIEGELDNVKNWIFNYYQSYDYAVNELNNILHLIIEEIKPNESYALSYSGGLDSELLKIFLKDAVTYTVITSKDIVADRAPTDNKLLLDEKCWAEQYREVCEKLKLPVLSWSLVGLNFVCQSLKERIIFTGNGADELFGGYSCYQMLTESPYTDNTSGNRELADLKKEYTYYKERRSNTLLLDFILMTGCVDVLGANLICGSNSIESRNPFMHKDIVKFALSIPIEYKINEYPKQILRDLFKLRTGYSYDLPKQGFAGHCNDSIKFLDQSYHSSTDDRYGDWRRFNLYYYENMIR